MTVGTHSITAAYSGDVTYDPETSEPIDHEVTKASTTTTPARNGSTTNPSPFSAPVGFTATVAAGSPGAGTPSGTVEFKDGSTIITGCAAAALSAGVASCDASGLAIGDHTITTTYSGDDSYLTSNDAAFAQAVGNAATTTVLTSSDSNTSSNEPVTYTATIASVSPATATPDGGTVEFFVGGDTIAGCEAQDVGLGTATCETVSEPVGAPTITAEYSGTDNFDGSTATGITQTVGNADTTTEVVALPLNTSFTYGDDITFTTTIAPVSPATVPPDAGTVSITADGVSIADCQLLDVSAGTATCTTDVLNAGIPSISADYSGTTGFNNSSGSTGVTVAPADTETVVTSGSNPSINSETVTFTATVTSDGGTPSGSVDFSADGEPIAGCSAATTVNGAATCDTAALPVGQNQEIVASFTSNDGNHNESTSPAFDQDVDAAGTSVGVISDDAASSYSQPVTFSASISSIAPATATPDEGTVTFRSGTTTITGCATQAVSGGVATCTTGALAVGNSSITATYNANDNFDEGVSSSLSQDVAQADTTIAVTSSDASTAAGESVTFTATVSPVAPAIGTPTGAVAFALSPPISGCNSVDVENGTATCTTSALPVGDTTVSATYSATTNFDASTSSPITQTVGLADTTTAVASSDDSSVFAAPVTFTATVEVVEPGDVPLTGTVLFQSDGADIADCEAQPLSAGAATCTTSGLPLGESTITAIYSGTDETATSASSGLSQGIAQAPTSTGLTSATNPSIFSESVVFTATVTADAPSAGTPGGTASFSADELTISGCAAQPLTNGVATCTVAAFEVGDHNVVASYTETDEYASSSSEPVEQTVTLGGTTTAVATSDSTTTWSEGVSYTATIAPVSPATGTATGGTVNFRSNGTSLTGCAAIAVSSGTAVCTTATTPVGTPSITAVFSGDDEFSTSTSTGITQTVVKATNTTVAVSSNPTSTYSESITFTATISPTAPATAPPAGGTVNFNLFGSSFTACTAQPVNSSGVATCTTTAVPVGDHLVAAFYSGDGNFRPSVSSLIDQSVTEASTTTIVTSSDTTTSWRSPVTFTATVSPTAPATLAPSSGTVGFTADGDLITGCASTDVDAGIATCDGSALPVGANTIAAVYSGSESYLTSTAPGLTQTISKATAAAVVTSSDTTTVWGEAVTFTATVSPDAPATATPTGTLSFYRDGDINVGDCTNVTVSSGSATCVTSSLPVGTESITTSYNGSASYLNDTSPAITQTIAKSASTTTLVSGTNPAVVGSSVIFTATVAATAPGTGTPTGSVAFRSDGDPIDGCTARTLSAGSATCTLTASPIGTSSITAVYAATTNYLTSTSSATIQTVGKQSTTTVVTTNDATTIRTEPVTFTATIAPVSPGTASPGGAVAFNLSGIPISGCTARTVSTGVATCTTGVLPVGSALSITAIYSGDSISTTSTSAPITQTVAKASATTVLSSDNLTAVFGEPVTLTATMSPATPATSAPTTGTVAFNDGGIAIDACDEQPITTGVATCTTSALAIGSHELTTTAAPTADFESSTSPAITQTITRSKTRTALTPLDTPADVGSSVRFRVTVTASGGSEGTPTGIVALYRTRTDGSRQWIGRLNTRTGTGTITIAGIPAGLHLIVAEYRGNADFTPSHRSARQRIDH